MLYDHIKNRKRFEIFERNCMLNVIRLSSNNFKYLITGLLLIKKLIKQMNKDLNNKLMNK